MPVPNHLFNTVKSRRPFTIHIIIQLELFIHAMFLRTTFASGITCLLIAASSQAAHQTTDFSPVLKDGSLPYRITLREYDFGPSELPTLHSFAAGHYDGKWVVLAGRTNGLHGFESNPFENFPPEYQNQEVWVIDPVNKTSWRRDLTGPTGGLTDDQIKSITPTNTQFYQRGDTVYMSGGYGHTSDDPNGNALNSTFNTLTAFDLPGLVDWVQNDSGLAADHIRQLEDERMRVTGGAMYEINGRTYLTFGQDYGVNYSLSINGEYTHQVRSFDIVDDGTDLSIANYSAVGDPDSDPSFRRRDLNVYPVITPDGVGGVQQGITVLSGVFTPSFGIWSYPIEVDSAGNVTEVTSFSQAMNNYHSAKLGMFSELSGEMHEVLMGGITLKYFDEATESFVQDNRMPFTSQMTAVVVDPNRNYEQHLLGAFPEILDGEDNLLRFGANAEFFLAEGVATFENGVINMDELADETTLGYVYGGIVSNAPHVRNVPEAISGASDRVFEVLFTRVPEPNSLPLATFALLGILARTRQTYLRCEGKL